MDEILKYLQYKYGNGMDIYDALQQREKIDMDKLMSVQCDCDYITLLNGDYPDGFKKIYKPPFGIFMNGDSKLINNNRKFLTVLDKKLDVSQYEHEYVLVGYNPTKKQMKELSQKYQGNVFVVNQLKDYNDVKLPKGNVIISEGGECKDNDASKCRIYMGISGKVIGKLTKEQKEYTINEDIQVL